MATRSPPPKGSRRKSDKERRADEGAKGATVSLRKLKGLLIRPLGVERRDGKLQLVLTERRRTRPADGSPTPSQLCAELSDRLLAHEAAQAARTMRQLVFVHDMLERRGFAGIAAMSGRVLAEALDQLEMLASEYPSPQLDTLIEKLRPLQAAATLREESDSRLQDFDVGASLTVSESDFAEFEDAERDWVGTVPAGLARPERDD
jgi:hypothetical protein